ncbi:HAMP domain-containing histidine kinase [Tissierella creatinini]|nr:HAMP domain-containing histidine kinase [Tissierella creatinini]TJX66358.1 HAMP domain-containing histidine kinase [Soehngenia saccharolytica]
MGKTSESEDINNLSIIENSKMMRELSDQIFHDFKNILTTISGLAQLSMIKTQSNEIKDYLAHINRATFDFRDTLDKYHSYTSGGQLEIKAYILKDILNNALEMILYKANRPNHRHNIIKMVLDIDSDASVMCSENEVKQTLLNIMMNAIDAMENSGGTLTIDIKDDGSFIIVNIIDTGVGIPEENLDKVFESKFTTKESGTGLGLKIAKDTLERLGGSLNLTSKVNQGTKVEMVFPIYDGNKEG